MYLPRGILESGRLELVIEENVSEADEWTAKTREGLRLWITNKRGALITWVCARLLAAGLLSEADREAASP